MYVNRELLQDFLQASLLRNVQVTGSVSVRGALSFGLYGALQGSNAYVGAAKCVEFLD
jgi:hypothetical protein